MCVSWLRSVNPNVCHDVRVIRSKVLTAVHGFPTRDEVPERKPILVNQVHGDRVVEAALAPTDADALWTSTLGASVGIKTADCVPLLLEDPVSQRVAAVHAGWRGAIAEIPLRALEALGSEAKNVRAAIGPHIRACCYAVGEDLAERFAKRFGPSVVTRRDGQVYLDLSKAVRAQLEEFGVSQIDDVEGLCTSCDRRFHSFRREKGAPGRQVSYIVCEWPRGAGATSL